jgi:ketosteroid isomerase-like protein
MSGSEQERGKAVSVRLLEALNAHDLEGQLGLFDEDYHSEQPAHPARTFSGREQVQENWSKHYESIPDFRAELLRLAIVGEEEWGEWIWRGTKEDGTPLEERGVTIMGIRDGQIAGDACISRKPNGKVRTSPRPYDSWPVGRKSRHQTSRVPLINVSGVFDGLAQ